MPDESREQVPPTRPIIVREDESAQRMLHEPTQPIVGRSMSSPVPPPEPKPTRVHVVGLEAMVHEYLPIFQNLRVQHGGAGVSQPELLLNTALVNFGGEATDGALIESVTVSFFELLKAVHEKPELLHQVHWRKMEELVAAVYKNLGFEEVILTPRSGDKGRDVIASGKTFSKPGIGSIMIVEQIKAYKNGHLINLDEVHSVLGVLTKYPNVSKAVLTTTSDFAPGVYSDKDLKRFLPSRLELRNGQQLQEWLDLHRK